MTPCAARPSLLLRAARAARLTLAAAATSVAAACGDNSTEPNASVVGTYALVSFGGQAVPQTQTGGGVRSELLGGALALRGDQTFEITLDIRDTDIATGVVEDNPEAVSGSYTVRGRVITFANTTGGELDGAQAQVSANSSTVVLGAFTFRQ